MYLVAVACGIQSMYINLIYRLVMVVCYVGWYSSMLVVVAVAGVGDLNERAADMA